MSDKTVIFIFGIDIWSVTVCFLPLSAAMTVSARTKKAHNNAARMIFTFISVKLNDFSANITSRYELIYYLSLIIHKFA